MDGSWAKRRGAQREPRQPALQNRHAPHEGDGARGSRPTTWRDGTTGTGPRAWSGADSDRGVGIGVPWLASTGERCDYCLAGRENLCDEPIFTGHTRDGGYAEYAVAGERFLLPIPDGYSDAEAAPLLCAGLIGYRSLKKAGDARRLGLYGFGAAAHIVTQLARYQGRDVYAFTRPGDTAGQIFARSLGAVWA